MPYFEGIKKVPQKFYIGLVSYPSRLKTHHPLTAINVDINLNLMIHYD